MIIELVIVGLSVTTLGALAKVLDARKHSTRCPETANCRKSSAILTALRNMMICPPVPPSVADIILWPIGQYVTAIDTTQSVYLILLHHHICITQFQGMDF